MYKRQCRDSTVGSGWSPAQQRGFHDSDLGLGIGDPSVENHRERLVEIDREQVEELIGIEVLGAPGEGPGEKEVDDLAAVSRNRIDIAERLEGCLLYTSRCV